MLTKIQAVLLSRHHPAFASWPCFGRLQVAAVGFSPVSWTDAASTTSTGCQTQRRYFSRSFQHQQGCGPLLCTARNGVYGHNTLLLKCDPHEHTSVRHAGQAQRKDTSKQVVESKDKSSGQLTVGQKVAQAGKDATYTGVIIVGFGVTALMFYAIGRELFSGQSSSGVYTKAYKLCKRNGEIIDALGEPIKGYGEMTRRGRRRHVSHTEFSDPEGVKHMRMKFYVEGPLRKGTVQLEVKQNESGKYEYRYLFVDLDGYPRRTIVLEDNR